MRALSLAPDLAVREHPDPEPGPGEALIRVSLSGICNTDLELVRGYMGFSGILGHEFVGEVIACDDAGWLGKRVCGEINLGCGQCAQCERGLARHCPHRRVLGILGKDGCLAEQLTLPLENLREVPDAVPDELAVFTEPLAAAYEILEQVHIAPGMRVLVLGDGKLGLLIAMALSHTGAEVAILGRHAEKLALAQACGVATYRAPDVPAPGYDVVVEATGSPQGLETAIGLLRPRGTLVLKSTHEGNTEVALAPLVIHELTLVGSRCGLFEPALHALATRLVDPRPMLHERFGLSHGREAMQRATEPGVLKVLIEPG